MVSVAESYCPPKLGPKLQPRPGGLAPTFLSPSSVFCIFFRKQGRQDGENHLQGQSQRPAQTPTVGPPTCSANSKKMGRLPSAPPVRTPSLRLRGTGGQRRCPQTLMSPQNHPQETSLCLPPSGEGASHLSVHRSVRLSVPLRAPACGAEVRVDVSAIRDAHLLCPPVSPWQGAEVGAGTSPGPSRLGGQGLLELSRLLNEFPPPATSLLPPNTPFIFFYNFSHRLFSPCVLPNLFTCDRPSSFPFFPFFLFFN